jgi:hypothetical protein
MSLSRFLAEIKSKIVNNLTEGGVDNILSAEQGKELQDTKVAKAGDTMTGLLRATAGINFNASGGDTLDDYEIGTWTPVGNGITFTAPEGHYTKIGNVVTVIARVIFPNTASASIARIQGLPFTGKFNMASGSIALTDYGSSDITVFQSGNNFLIRTYSNVNLINADLSQKFIYCSATYNI